MKRLVFIIFIVSVTATAYSAYSSKITDVIVYQNGAKITRSSTVKLEAGNNEIILSNLTTSIDANSIQVKVLGSTILLSASTRVRTLEDKELPVRTKSIEDSISGINKRINWLNSQKHVYQGEEKLITANQKLGNEQEKMAVEELIRLSEFYRTRLIDIHKKIHAIDFEISVLNTERSRLQQLLNNLRHKEKKRVGEIIVSLSSKVAKSEKLVVSYLTYNAGWNPFYDVRAEGADKPISLVYKANVFQSTGYDWKEVDLTISTGNPRANNNRPIMYPWYIGFIEEWIGYEQEKSYKKSAAPAMNIMQRSMEPMAMDEAEIMEEAVPVPYEVTETTNRMSAEYKIEIAQEIPSDGKTHIVAMQQYDLNSKFIYHSIPKLDKGAYLLAKVADYGQFNLLPGQSNLFYHGMYIGQSYLNPVTTVDSMLLSLGQDDKITVKRNQLQNLTSTQILGVNAKELKGYEISVRNNNAFAIEMELMDQVPLSKHGDIEVKVEETSNAIYNEEYGSLLWKLNMKPGETKIVKFIYSVKYPKDRSVSGL